MAAVAGRGTDTRTVTVSKTNASTAVTGAAGTFQSGDVGRSISGTGIAASTTISAVASGTAATLSIAATATSSNPAVISGGADGAVYGYRGWSPETDAEAATLTIAGGAGASDPSRILSNNASRPEQRSR